MALRVTESQKSKQQKTAIIHLLLWTGKLCLFFVVIWSEFLSYRDTSFFSLANGSASCCALKRQPEDGAAMQHNATLPQRKSQRVYHRRKGLTAINSWFFYLFDVVEPFHFQLWATLCWCTNTDQQAVTQHISCLHICKVLLIFTLMLCQQGHMQTED